MAEFAGYGLNKSHSCAYAWLAYQTAYLKAHYPVEFMAALLTSEVGDRDKFAACANECRLMGIQVLVPDVNSSDLVFQPEGNDIRFGLAATKNLGEMAARSILTVRHRLSRFDNFHRFRAEIDSRSAEQTRNGEPRQGRSPGFAGLEHAQMIAALGMNRIAVVPTSPGPPTRSLHGRRQSASRESRRCWALMSRDTLWISTRLS